MGGLGVKVLRVLGYLWSLPYGLVGLAAAALFWALRWRRVWAWRAGALNVIVQGPLADRMNRSGWAAFTLGWTIFWWRVPDGILAKHEERHVVQALWLGPLYPVMYLLLLGTSVIGAFILIVGDKRAVGVSPRQLLKLVMYEAYRSNPLEVDAREAAGQLD